MEQEAPLGQYPVEALKPFSRMVKVMYPCFARHEPLRRVHACVFGALEREPVDPRRSSEHGAKSSRNPTWEQSVPLG